MDSLPPIKYPDGLLPVRQTISNRHREQLASRIHSWKRRDAWTLREACDIAFGLIPIWIVHQLHPRATEAGVLMDHAIRAGRVGNLTIGNPGQPEHKWWVTPRDFGLWAAGRPDLVGQDRARIFALSFPTQAAVAAQASSRRKVLESDYSTPELDALLAAIEKFWLAHQPGDAPPNHKLIETWLQEHFGLSETAAKRIDTVIRSVDAKRGGPKGQPHKTQ